jgi:hypothetical protein
MTNGGDLVRFQLVAMGLGMFATIAVSVLPMKGTT